VVLIVPGETFHRGVNFGSDPAATNNQPDTLKQLLGGLIFATFAPLALCAACVCASLALGSAPSGGAPAAPPASGAEAAAAAAALAPPTPLTPHGLAMAGNWRGAAWLVLLAACLTFASAIFTPVWNFSSTSYFPSQSLDAQGKSWSMLDPSLRLVLGPIPADTLGWQQPIVYIKLYSDVVVYFSFLLAVAGLGLVGQTGAAAGGLGGWLVQHRPGARRTTGKRWVRPALEPAAAPLTVEASAVAVSAGVVPPMAVPPMAVSVEEASTVAVPAVAVPAVAGAGVVDVFLSPGGPGDDGAG
jgi:hypothetical protein